MGVTSALGARPGMWIKLKESSMEEKEVLLQPKSEPEQKRLQVDEEGLPKARKGEGWWKAWVKVRGQMRGRRKPGPGL